MNPAPRRDTGPNWAEFLRSQAHAIRAADFVVIDPLDGTKASVLAAIERGSRRVRILGAINHPVKDQAVQQARNLAMDLEDAAVHARFLIHDRDASFCTAFDQIPADADIEVIRGAARTPRMNSIMERWFRALGQAASLQPLPDNVIDPETFRVRRRDRAEGLLHEYRQTA